MLGSCLLFKRLNRCPKNSVLYRFKYAHCGKKLFSKTTLLQSNFSCNSLGVNSAYHHIDERPLCTQSVNFSHKPSPFCQVKPSSKLEETVIVFKSCGGAKSLTKTKKKSVWERIKEEGRHYYHATKLLNLNIKVTTGLYRKTLKGQKLSRREKKLLIRTTGDIFKLIPFSLFVFVPLLEFTLPIFLVLFPSMLPSPYETKDQKDSKIKKKFKAQLELTKFLQNTLLSMSVDGRGKVSHEAAEFAEFFKKVRGSGGRVTPEEVMRFSRLFRDEITLDSLPRAQLRALAKVLGLRPLGTTAYLRYLVQLKLRKIKVDDYLIYTEGVDYLSADEVESACIARGIRTWGLEDLKLRDSLTQWLQLSIENDLPPSLLLLSQVFMFPSEVPPKTRLAETIESLPGTVISATQSDFQKICGQTDYRTECQCIQEELEKIREEMGECYPPQTDPAKSAAYPQQNDMECALCCLLAKKMRLERENLALLKQQMHEYEKMNPGERVPEDWHFSAAYTVAWYWQAVYHFNTWPRYFRQLLDEREFQEMLNTLGRTDIQTPKAALRLKVILKKKINSLCQDLSKMESTRSGIDPGGGEMSWLELRECSETLESLPRVSLATKAKVLRICHRLDRGQGGRVTSETLLKVSNVLEHLESSLSQDELDEILELIDKEGLLTLNLPALEGLRSRDDLTRVKEAWVPGRRQNYDHDN